MPLKCIGIIFGSSSAKVPMFSGPQWSFFTDVLALLQLACFNYTDTLIAGKHFALTSAALSNLLLGMSPTQTHH